MEIIVFSNNERVGEGDVSDALEQVRRFQIQQPDADLMVLDRETSKVLEVDFEQPDEVIERLLGIQVGEPPRPAKRGRGRPRLGVQSREVSLLPRHWEWLNSQPGGASAALRRLVEEARKSPEVQAEEARLAVDRFLQTLAGDLPHYEEALRQFYRRQYGLMYEQMADWPADIQRHARWLASRAQEWEAELGDPRRQNRPALAHI